MASSSQNRQKVILKIAFEKFRKKEYTRTYISEIAADAGLPMRALKRIYASKKDIFRALFDKEKAEVYIKLNKLLSHTDITRKPDVAETFRRLFKTVLKNNFLNMIFTFGDFPVVYCLEDSRQNGKDMLTGKSSLLEKFITDCQKTGVVRPGDAAGITHALRSLLYVFLHEQLAFLKTKGVDTLLTDIFIDGLIKNKTTKNTNCKVIK
ncbi:hypothetical protein AMJ80_06420 [bacterium SM23_31]|nr:MAG: hypothetical protein AMJ80_06420 [bacterium SM23_31]